MGKRSLTALILLLPWLGCAERAAEDSRAARETLDSLQAGVDLDAEGRVTFVNLSHKALTDDQLACVEPLTDLRQLWLYDTNISDDGLQHLSGLTNLEVLVLGKTRITDRGLQELHALTNLKELYLYETEVTPRGVDRLQKVLTSTVIVRGDAAAKSNDRAGARW